MEHWTGILTRGVTEPAMQTVQMAQASQQRNRLIASLISSYFNQAFFLRGGEGFPLSRPYSSSFEAGVAQSQSVQLVHYGPEVMESLHRQVCFLRNVQTPSGAHTASYSVGSWFRSPGGKASGA